jgi:pimeloyl-ACP methyl ester carboxylesterase
MNFCRYWKCCLVALAFTTAPACAQSPETTPPDPALLPYVDTATMVTLADGRRIHFTCMGQGSPTIILMAGAGDWGETWSKVQPAIALKTKVCAWDRAGFGLSDASPVEQTITATTNDLAAAVDKGKLGQSYLLVAHSLGGLEALLLADRQPQQISGMVLVDPSIPDQFELFARKAPAVANFLRRNMEQQAAYLRRCSDEIRSGKVAIGTPDPDGCLRYPASYPAMVSAALARADSDPARLATQASFIGAFEKDTKLAVNSRRSYNNMPLIVLTAAEMQEFPKTESEATAQLSMVAGLWRDGHDRLAALSTQGSSRIVSGSSHYIQQIKPEAVISAIDEILEKIRMK